MITREQLDWLSANFPPNARLSSIKTKCLTRIVAAELQNAMAIERMEAEIQKAFGDMLHHGTGVLHVDGDICSFVVRSDFFEGSDAMTRDRLENVLPFPSWPFTTIDDTPQEMMPEMVDAAIDRMTNRGQTDAE
jgi:hypothetical protein